MADTFGRASAGISIANDPKLTTEQKKDITLRLVAAGIKFTGTYAEAEAALSGQNTAPSTGAPTAKDIAASLSSTPKAPDVKNNTSAADIAASLGGAQDASIFASDTEALKAAEKNIPSVKDPGGRASTKVPTVNIHNIAGEVLSESGPEMLAGVAGGVTGLVSPFWDPATGAAAGYAAAEFGIPAADVAVKGINKVLTKLGKEEIQEPSKLYDELMDYVGVGKANTPTEQAIANVINTTLDGLGMAGLAYAKLKQVPLEAKNKLLTKVYEIFADRPFMELLGGAGSAAGTEGGKAIIDSKAYQDALNNSNLPPYMKEAFSTAIPMVTGLAGGVLGGAMASDNIPGRVASVDQKLRVKNEPAIIPSATREAIESADRRMIDLPTSAVATTPGPDSALAQARRDAGASAKNGTRQMWHTTDSVRSNIVKDLRNTYSVEISGLGTADDQGRAIAENFLKNNDNNLFKEMKNQKEVIEGITGQPMGDFEIEVLPGGKVIDFSTGKEVTYEPKKLTLYQEDLPPVGELKSTLGNDTYTPKRSLATLEAEAPAGEALIIPRESRDIVEMNESLSFIKDTTDRLNRISPTRYKATIAELGKWEDDIQGQTLQDLYTLRRTLQESYKDENIPTGMQTVLNELYTKVNKDFTDHIKIVGGPKEYNKYMVATNNLKTMIDKYRLPQWANALRNGDIDYTAVSKLLTDDNMDIVVDAVDTLDAEGQKLAKTHLMGAIIEASLEGQKYSGDTASAFLTTFDKPLQQMMEPDEYNTVSGIKAFLDSTSFAEMVTSGKAASERGVNPATLGAGFGPATARYTQAYTGPVLAASTISNKLKGAWYRNYESPEVRDLLLKIRNTRAGTTAREEFAKRIIDAFRASDMDMGEALTEGNSHVQGAVDNAAKYGMTTTGIPGVQ